MNIDVNIGSSGCLCYFRINTEFRQHAVKGGNIVQPTQFWWKVEIQSRNMVTCVSEGEAFNLIKYGSCQGKAVCIASFVNV